MVLWRKWREIWEIGKGEDERIGGKENGVVAEMEGNLGDWKGRR